MEKELIKTLRKRLRWINIKLKSEQIDGKMKTYLYAVKETLESVITEIKALNKPRLNR